MEQRGSYQKVDSNINDMVSPVHSQVKKIKQESNKLIIDLLPDTRPVLRDITDRQISRSPLGLSNRPISVGDS